MEAHFIDVGCGNMSLLIMPSGSVIVYDCNITDDNKDRILRYVGGVIGMSTSIELFVNSHRDADHMRGIEILHKHHTISEIADSGVPGTTTDSPEYRQYMSLCNRVQCRQIKPRTFRDVGGARLRYMSGCWDDFSDPNEQSVVLKVEYAASSIMFAGDTNFRPWREKILPFYRDDALTSSILLASHHGSISFFDDPSDEKNYYVEHIKKIEPAMTLISVGPNPHGLPDDKAVELYDKYSSGSNKGHKVYTTEDKGTMKLVLKDEGGWSLTTHQ